MRTAIVGCGRWGSFIAWYLDQLGHQVSLYGRPSSGAMRRLLEQHGNDLLTLPPSVALTTEPDCLRDADCILISIGAQNLRALMEELQPLRLQDKILVLCMKGLEAGTGLRLSAVVSEYLHASNAIAVWLGPGHVQEFLGGIPNCMVIDSADEPVKQQLVEAFSGSLIRFYYGQDLIGNEVGAAAKNVIGIAAGVLDGLRLSTLKGALMSRGTREIARLIQALGGSELSAYGLCHLGDYEATVFSKYSHNRRFGEAFALGEPYADLAEGVATVQALVHLGAANGVDLPICRSVYQALYQGATPQEMLDSLFARSLKNEF